jgi:hypothetical protein
MRRSGWKILLNLGRVFACDRVKLRKRYQLAAWPAVSSSRSFSVSGLLAGTDA